MPSPVSAFRHSHRQAMRVLTMAFLCGLLAPAVLPGAVYTTSGSDILQDGVVWSGGGVNAQHIWSGTDSYAGYTPKIVRETIVNISAANLPLATTDPKIPYSGGWLQPLQNMVNNNRAIGAITILNLYSWASQTDMTGQNPLTRSFWQDGSYQARLQRIATFFKDQKDVWIDPWNEPWSTQATQADWEQAVSSMYTWIRATGNTNIMLVPGAWWSAHPTYFVNGASWLSGKSNVVASMHSYWDLNSLGHDGYVNAMQSVLRAGWPIVMGEIGAYVPNYLDPTPALRALSELHITTLAWQWTGADVNAMGNYQNGAYVIRNTWGDIWLGQGWMSRFTPRPIGQTRAIWSPSAGSYITCNENYVENYLYSGAAAINNWEKFTIADAGAGMVALQTNTGRYVTCDVNDGGRLDAGSATQIGNAERFYWINLGNGNLALKSYASGFYVTWNPNDANHLEAQWATSPTGWETFTNVATAPSKVTGLAATAGAVGTRMIVLTWIRTPGAASFDVYRATSANGTYALLGSTTGASYSNSGLTAGQTYYYAVAAKNTVGVGPQSAAASATAR